jgi:hypothetical protein
MILTYFKTAMLFTFSILLFSACEEKLPTEFGNSIVYFSSTSYLTTFKGVDTLNIDNIKAEADTVYNVAAIYRSGIVDNLEEITVSVAIDSAYLDSVILAAKTALPTQMTDLMTAYKNSKALGSSYFSIPQTVTIPKGDRRVTMPITVRRSFVKLFNNANFNYNAADLASATVPKDKKLVLPIKITATTSQPILQKQNRYYFQILKIGNLK